MKTVRDADGVPYLEPRPQHERHTVEFPPFIDRATADRALRTSERNVWKSVRNDRSQEFGIGRYGFFRCGGCGRALTVTKPKIGHHKYACTSHAHMSRPCHSPTSISVDRLDNPVWWWVQSVIEDPTRGDAWLPVETAPVMDELTLQALIEVEQGVAELEARAAGMLDNLTLLVGPAARMAANKLNGLNTELEAATAHRDTLAATAMKADSPPVKMILATDALSAATFTALEAMKAADPNPERTHTIEVVTPVGVHGTEVPDSWKTKRAAMTALGVGVTVHQEAADAPRWVAEMRLPGGAVIRGANNGAGWFTSPDSLQPGGRSNGRG